LSAPAQRAVTAAAGGLLLAGFAVMMVLDNAFA